MSAIYNELNILDLIFNFPVTHVTDAQFNALRVELSAIQRTALREFYCHQKSIIQISEDLETSTLEVQRYIAFGLTQLKQYQKQLYIKLGNVVLFRVLETKNPYQNQTVQMEETEDD